MLAGAALILIVLNAPSGADVSADTPHSGLDFSIGLDTNGDGTDNCNSSGSPSDTCYVIDRGDPVAVNLYLDSAGLPDYKGYHALLEITGGYFAGKVLHTWPDCGAPDGPVGSPPVNPYYVDFGCFVSPWNQSSTYTGKIAEITFDPCNSFTNFIRLHHGPSGTQLFDSDSNAHAEGTGSMGTERIDFVCAFPTSTPVGGSCSSSTLGDVDGDNDVDAIDAMFTLQYDAGLRPSLFCPTNGNVNHSSPSAGPPSTPPYGITSVDGTLILQKVAGLIAVFP
jgi:hypothetical protein